MWLNCRFLGSFLTYNIVSLALLPSLDNGLHLLFTSNFPLTLPLPPLLFFCRWDPGRRSSKPPAVQPGLSVGADSVFAPALAPVPPLSIPTGGGGGRQHSHSNAPPVGVRGGKGGAGRGRCLCIRLGVITLVLDRGS